MNSKRISLRHGFWWLIAASDLYDLGFWTLVAGALIACGIGVFGLPLGVRVVGILFFVAIGIAHIYTSSREFGPLKRTSRIHILLRFLRMRRRSCSPLVPPILTVVCWVIVATVVTAYVAASGWQSPVETLATAIISLTLFIGGIFFWHEQLQKSEKQQRRRDGWE